MASRREGTQGYAHGAEQRVADYESLRFDDVQREVLHLFPPAPSRVLDIGAGTGRDAAALSRLGHRVVAVEPTPELRRAGERIHSGLGIIWVDDALPALARVAAPKGGFDLILLTAVWMHLGARARERGMARLAELLAATGLVSISLRHGPVPPGRQMFDVTGAETAALAVRHGLRRVHESMRGDMRDRPGISWTYLALAGPQWLPPR